MTTNGSFCRYGLLDEIPPNARRSQAGTTGACLSLCGAAFRILDPPGRFEMGNSGSSNRCNQAVG